MHLRLLVAAQDGRLEVVRLLLNAGAEISPTQSQNGGALHLAARRGRVDVVRLLLEFG